MFETTPFTKQQLSQIKLPLAGSHKGQNGRVLVVGGSSLFHSASLWAAKLLSHFADLVFYYSPCADNRQICLSLKKSFRNGIIIVKKDLDNYVKEADVVLLGPGMMRQGAEGKLAARLTNSLLGKFTSKKFVIDAGALQQLELKNIQKQYLLTPHFKEYQCLFGVYKTNYHKLLQDYPATYLLKKNGVDDIFSFETMPKIYQVALGNQGLTKGGSGDLLAALATAFYIKNPAWIASAAASFVLNLSGDDLYQQVGPFYTTSKLLEQIPKTFWKLIAKNPK